MKNILSLLTAIFVSLAASGFQEADSTKKKKKDLPLEADRTFSIKTSEASWMSLDISPDGQTLAFDFLGDLYTMSVSGGEATQITSGMAFDGQPRFSPDGKELVFTSTKVVEKVSGLLILRQKKIDKSRVEKLIDINPRNGPPMEIISLLRRQECEEGR